MPLKVRTAERFAAWTLNSRQRYATEEELSWLRGVAGTLPPESLAVILGAGPGVMLAALKDGNPSMHAFLVDIDSYDYAIQHMTEFGPEYHQDVYGLLGDSAAVGTRYSGTAADILIIDADHSEEAVARDIICWLSHVKEFGYIFLHDYDAEGTWFADQERYPGVKAAADRFLGGYKVVGRVGTSIIYANERVDA